MPNDIKLQEGHPVDENLRPIKVGGKSTALETAQHGNGARINGDLEVTGDITGNIKDMVLPDVTIDPLNTNNIVSTDLTIDDSGDIALSADGGNITMNDGTTTIFDFDVDTPALKIMDDAQVANYCSISVGAAGATTLATVDDDAAVAHLTLDPDGDLIISGADVKIDAAKKLYLDGGSDTYLYEGMGDNVALVVGGDIVLTVTESGADGNHIMFRDTSVGFGRNEATFSATGIVGSGGTDDTDIDFRTTNKFRLEMTGDITTMNLIFPTNSCNCLLVCTTNGDHDVTNWKVYESDETAATTTDVLWAGGSVPAFTSSGVDIVSFYWDATEQQAYGVASLAFATP